MTNADGRVDIADLNNVRNNFGGTGLDGTDANGTIEVTDLNNVRNNFGASVSDCQTTGGAAWGRH